MDTISVQRVRRFNRTVAQRIGALTDHFLGSARPMGESRVLWEIAPEGTEVRALRTRLGLDSGYTSRVLRALERQGLITLDVSPGDRRVRRVHLTDTGLAERAQLDARSDDLARSVLEPLGDDERTRLLAAMGEVERLLRAAQLRIEVADPASPAACWCLEQYFAELNARFQTGFDPSRSLSADARELTPPAGALLIARLGDRSVGCGALKLHGDAPAELKRMWLAPDARGLGLARRLLHALELYARDHGAKAVRLETNRALTEAIALYRSSGYREVAAFNDEPYAHHWFEKSLA